jgi:hypothetical protein
LGQININEAIRLINKYIFLLFSKYNQSIN